MVRVDPAAAQQFAAGLRTKVGEDKTASPADVDAVNSFADNTERTGVVPNTVSTTGETPGTA